MSYLVIPQAELDRLLARISGLEAQLAPYEQLSRGIHYLDGVNGPDGDGNYEPAEYCIVCMKPNGKHNYTCVVGKAERLEARLAAAGEAGMTIYGITDTPSCPECGAPMKQMRRGASLRKRGTAFLCPVAREEFRLNVPKAERKHKWIASWSPEELAGDLASKMPTVEPDDLPF